MEVRVGGYLKDMEVVCACVRVCCKLFDIVVGMSLGTVLFVAQ